MNAALLRGFPPVVDDDARDLILGSFPSAQSLVTRQYYANPRNAFWPIVSELFGFEVGAPYDSRLASLRSHGVALWDVLHPTIARVYFNGAKAADLYRRLAEPAVGVQYQRLPSTSPAHVMRPGTKLEAWRAISLS